MCYTLFSASGLILGTDVLTVCTQEAFVMQLEGTKRWRIYAPRTHLATTHSGDLAASDLGQPIAEVSSSGSHHPSRFTLMQILLQPGDLLYFPRGHIHEVACFFLLPYRF